MKSKKKAANKFKTAVENTKHINKSYCNGLKALGDYSKKIELGDTTSCEGSVDIDSAVRALYPQSNRWDYCFGYCGEIFFVEVHSANTSEVTTVLKKLQWLKDWLQAHATEINNLKAKSKTPYYWIQSKGFDIPKTSPQYRLAVTNKIKPVAKLVLP